MTTKIRKAISKYTETLSLSKEEDVIFPLNNTTGPIVGLELCEGFKYNTCEYISKAPKMMVRHCYELHSYVRLKGIQWSRRSIQMFFPNPKHRYFAVNVRRDDDRVVDSDDGDPDPYDDGPVSSFDRLLEAFLEETELREEERRRSINIV